MCGPVTVPMLFAASVATTAASTVMGAVGQAQAAKAQNDYEQAQFDQNEEYRRVLAENTATAYLNDVASEGVRLGQDRLALGQQKFDAALERRAAGAKAVASSSGGGQSLTLLLRDYEAEEARFRARTDRQEQGLTQQTAERQEAHRADGQSRINSATPYIPRFQAGPSIAEVGLNIGSGALQSYTALSRRVPGTNKRTL